MWIIWWFKKVVIWDVFVEFFELWFYYNMVVMLVKILEKKGVFKVE